VVGAWRIVRGAILAGTSEAEEVPAALPGERDPTALAAVGLDDQPPISRRSA
jgi:hypothetical protein